MVGSEPKLWSNGELQAAIEVGPAGDKTMQTDEQSLIPDSQKGSPPMVPPDTGTQASDVVKLAGRGTVYITLAKFYFMLTGLGTYLVLPRLLTVEQFGLYSVVANVASIINAVVINGTMQTVSKFVSQDLSLAEAVKRKALQLQLLIGGGISLGYFLLAPVIASLLHDPKLTTPFRLTAFITLSYSFYAIFLGSLNGRREFFKQAALDISYSTFKIIGVVGLAAAGFAVMGALSGWLLASVSVLILSIFVAGWKQKVGTLRARDLLGFQGMVLIFILVVNLLQKVDLLLVKGLSSSDAQMASAMAGYYNAVMTISNVTFQSTISISFVVFPLVSQSTFTADREATNRYIAQALRFSLMIMALLAILFSSNAAGLLQLIYTQTYLKGVPALMVAPFGMVFFGLLSVIATIISASGRPRFSVSIGILTLVTSILLNAWLIPRYQLLGAALGTLAAMLLGSILGCVYMLKRFGALMPLRSGLNISLAAAAIYLLSVLVPATGLILVLKLIVQGAAYVGLLLVLKEIGGDELQAIRRIMAG